MLVLVLVLALAPGPLLALAVPPDAALVTPLLPPAANVVLVTVVGSNLELAPSVTPTSLLTTSTLHVSTGMSQMHSKVAANDPLTRMRTQSFHRLCVHVM